MPSMIMKNNEDVPKISILMPTLNCESTLPATLEAIRNQSYKNIEVVVVDGGSVDKTTLILEQSSLDIRLFRQQGRGIWGGINEAIGHACGSYYFSLNSDDLISTNALSTLVEKAERENLDCVWLATYSAGGYKNVFDFSRRWLGMDRVTPGHSASFLIRASVQQRTGGYKEEVKYCADHELFYRLWQDRVSMGVVNSPQTAFGVFTDGGYSFSNDYFAKALEEFNYRRAASWSNVHDFIYCWIVLPMKFIWSLKKKLASLLRSTA